MFDMRKSIDIVDALVQKPEMTTLLEKAPDGKHDDSVDFRTWFDDSAVVDGAGAPLKLYFHRAVSTEHGKAILFATQPTPTSTHHAICIYAPSLLEFPSSNGLFDTEKFKGFAGRLSAGQALVVRDITIGGKREDLYAIGPGTAIRPATEADASRPSQEWKSINKSEKAKVPAVPPVALSGNTSKVWKD